MDTPNAAPAALNTINNQASLIWNIADLLRGDFKQYEYADVILPLTVMRRLDSVLAPTHARVQEQYLGFKDKLDNLDPVLTRASGQKFYNTSRLTFTDIATSTKDHAVNLRAYIQGFSQNVRELFTDHFGFMTQIDRLDSADLLYLVLQKFSTVDLSPAQVSNLEMGYVFEELIRKFNEQSNETAGEHFTPREVIRLMVSLLFTGDEDALNVPGVVRTVYDPTAGTGGMLSIAKEHVREQVNAKANIRLFGQELNPKSYAVCKSDLLIVGEDDSRIYLGNSLTQDQLNGREGRPKTFDYMLSNPPFGVDWKKIQTAIEEEHSQQGFEGRFGAGTPRVSDGSLLFLQHLISKMKPEGSRIAIVLNGSPLFTGDAGSGESEIRRWILENDWLDALIALPDQLFYNTGISTYIWVLDNAKPESRRGKVQLINAAGFSRKIRKSLGDKRNEISPEQIREIVRLYREAGEAQSDLVKIFDTTDFGYRKVTVERPLRLNYQASLERIERLNAKKSLQKLAAETRQGLVTALVDLGEDVYRDHKVFERQLHGALLKARVKLKTPELKAVLEALSERDEAGEIVTDKDGRPLPDPDLRDTESVPLNEDVQAYFEREVRPYVPDAWINTEICDHKDGLPGKVGYEISFTRYFYTYTPPRPLEAIQADIRTLEAEIMEMLRDLNV